MGKKIRGIYEEARPARGNEKGKQYRWAVRWRYQGKQATLRVDDYQDALLLKKQMDTEPMSVADAKAWLHRQTGLYVPEAASAALTLGQAIEIWAARPLDLADNTRQKYRNHAELLGDLRDRSIASLTREDMDALFGRLRAEGRAPRSMDGVRGTIRSAMKYAGTDPDPATMHLKGMDKRRKVKPIVLSDDQVADLLDNAIQMGPEIFGPVRLAADLGLRRGEVFGLLSQNVDLDRKVIRVEGQLSSLATYARDGLVILPPKTHRSERTLPLSDSLALVLERYVDYSQPGLPIFRNHPYTWWSYQSFQSRWHRLRTSTPSVPDALRFHDLRHTTAMRWAKTMDIATVSEALGHASVAVTASEYRVWNKDTEDRVRGALLAL